MNGNKLTFESRLVGSAFGEKVAKKFSKPEVNMSGHDLSYYGINIITRDKENPTLTNEMTQQTTNSQNSMKHFISPSLENSLIDINKQFCLIRENDIVSLLTRGTRERINALANFEVKNISTEYWKNGQMKVWDLTEEIVIAYKLERPTKRLLVYDVKLGALIENYKDTSGDDSFFAKKIRKYIKK